MVPKWQRNFVLFHKLPIQNLHKVIYCVCRVIRNVRNSHVEGLTIFFYYFDVLLTLNRKKPILSKVTKTTFFSDEASASRISFQSLVTISDVTSKVTASTCTVKVVL